MTRLNPITAPRHQLQAKKVRWNRRDALAAFIGKKAEIDAMLTRPGTPQRRPRYTHPDEINWGDVGTLEHYASPLKRITDSAFGEGEFA